MGLPQCVRHPSFLACLIAVLFRGLVMLHGYSGQGKPPMFGDFEAQRHWMEITWNLPLSEWYQHTRDNDLLYWGLDYPPLQAYHARLCAFVGSFFQPAWFALHSSRGLETPELKLFMRLTVLFTDILVFFPAAYLVCKHRDVLQFRPVGAADNNKPEGLAERRFLTLLFLLLCPPLVFIDYGHFQYNCLCLGFALWAIHFLLTGRITRASIAFCLCLNSKQIALFYAPAFFFFILGCIFQRRTWGARVGVLLRIAICVVGTFAVLWLPFWLSGHQSVLQVLRRCFPFDRGLFEDKVANVWCSISPVWKIQQHLTRSAVLRVCTTCTTSAFILSGMLLLKRPRRESIVGALLVSSLSFFLFSYQVHEKAILFVVLPLLLSIWRISPVACGGLLSSTMFSMFPLARKDANVTLYWCMQLCIWVMTTLCMPASSSQGNNSGRVRWQPAFPRTIMVCGMVTAFAVIHAVDLLWIPPVHLPDLVTLLFTASSCVVFCGLLLTSYYLQIYGAIHIDHEQNGPSNIDRKSKIE